MRTHSLQRLACTAGLLAGLLGLAACGGGGGGGGKVEVASRRADGTKLSAEDQAAAEFVRTKLAASWIKTGDGFTTQLQLRNVFGQVMQGTPDLLYKQYRELKFAVAPEALTETQRLNGADYRCVVTFENAPVRHFRTKETWEGPAGWSQWQDGDLYFHQIAIERRNGEWLIQDDDLFMGLKPDPSELPPARG